MSVTHISTYQMQKKKLWSFNEASTLVKGKLLGKIPHKALESNQIKISHGRKSMDLSA